ncbi:MAG: alanyl-tRNA editing protein [Clostridiaceae bacterium]
MTEKLYHNMPTVETCISKVLACRKTESAYEALLDKTVIFPESGGQLSDRGFLNDAAVLHAREENGLVWHETTAPFEVGAEVAVRLDVEARRDHSAQHTGEHILSGTANTLFGAVNVGFHMAEDYVTIDLDTYLDEAQITELERAANRAVQENLPVTVRIVDEQALEHIPLRKQAKGLTGEIRIVEVGAADSCTCCGTHTAASGEVGFIKITAAAKYKGGTRLWFACGMRAAEASRREHELLDALARRFSTRPEDVFEAVKKQGDDNAALRAELKKRTETLFSMQAETLLKNAKTAGSVKLALYTGQGFSMQELRTLSEKLTLGGNTAAALLSVNGESILYLFARGANVRFSMKQACEAANALFGGKGGGRDDGAQGSAPLMGESAFLQAATQLEDYLLRALKT